jgi:hypothetical protein
MNGVVFYFLSKLFGSIASQLQPEHGGGKCSRSDEFLQERAVPIRTGVNKCDDVVTSSIPSSVQSQDKGFDCSGSKIEWFAPSHFFARRCVVVLLLGMLLSVVICSSIPFVGMKPLVLILCLRIVETMRHLR